jgi:5'-3' exonuclease
LILIDMNQVLIANLMQQIGSNPKAALDENLIRHMVLNSLRSYAKQFRSKYGEIVIACDSKQSWRKGIFPFYKAHRKKDRENSGFDWHFIFGTFDKIRVELRENVPYRILEVEGAEADDIIGVLAARNAPHQEILILSSDKDFMQLQKYPGVVQYSPILKRFIKADNPLEYVKEHIIRGDRGDGIPNFLSSDNVFVTGERQKSISKKSLVEWINRDPKEFCNTEIMKRNYKRNQMLVDLDYIPDNIKSLIVDAYDNTQPANKKRMFNYFIENRLKNLMEVIEEF